MGWPDVEPSVRWESSSIRCLEPEFNPMEDA